MAVSKHTDEHISANPAAPQSATAAQKANAESLLSAIGNISDDILLDAMPAAIAAGVIGAGIGAVSAASQAHAATSSAASAAAGASGGAHAAGAGAAAGAAHAAGSALGAIGVSKVIATVAVCAAVGAGAVVGVNAVNSENNGEQPFEWFEHALSPEENEAQDPASSPADEEGSSASSGENGDDSSLEIPGDKPLQGNTTDSGSNNSAESTNPSEGTPPGSSSGGDNPGSSEPEPNPEPVQPVTADFSYMRSSLESQGAIPRISDYGGFVCKARFGSNGEMDYLYMKWIRSDAGQGLGENKGASELFLAVVPGGDAQAKAQVLAFAPASSSTTLTFNAGGAWYQVCDSAPYSHGTLVYETAWFFEAHPLNLSLFPRP